MENDLGNGKYKGSEAKNKKRKQENIWKIGTWNIRSMADKIQELEKEFITADLDILGITETKMKGSGEKILEGGHILIYSGVDQKERARKGVGCIIKRSNIKYVRKWTGINENILKIEFDLDRKSKTTILIVYGPNEDERVQVKEEFWETLTETIERVTDRLLILGDLNARVGRKDEESGDTVGVHGEDIKNNNGCRLIDFCLLNNLIITNTFYKHKDIHKYTREVKSRNEKSIIDYVIINKDRRKEVLDTRVKRGAEIYSDHYLVMSKIRVIRHEKAQLLKKDINKKKTKIRTYKLNETAIAKQYMDLTEREFSLITVDTNLENMWTFFKNTLLKIAKETCGTILIDKNKKKTSWWNEDIKTEVKTKKKLWQTYLNNRNNENYNKYKVQRLKVKEVVNTAKQKAWVEFGEKMEKDRHGNQKLFYKTLKTLKKGKDKIDPYITSKEGNILIGTDEIMERWKEYFEELLNTTQTGQQEKQEVNHETDEDNDHNAFTEEEVRTAVKRLKRGKAAGHDEITPEMLIHLGNHGIALLSKIINTAANEHQIPVDWEVGIILPVHKKNNKRDCKNYRGITLLSIVSKVYERLLDNILKETVELEMDESQCGFRKGRGIQDHIFTIKQIIEKNHGKNIYLAFLDLEKAFDSVPRKELWNSLKRRNINENLITNIASIYKRTRNYVRTNNTQSEEFRTNEGLRQGGVLSPTLFNIILDDITKEVKDKVKKLLIGYWNMEPIYLSQCSFADDLMICAKNEDELQKNLEIWHTALRQRNLKINLDKTKIMVLGNSDVQTTIGLNNRIIEQTNSFKYLGVAIQKDGKNETEINERVNNAMKLYYAFNRTFIWKQEISQKTKLTVYKSIVKPILSFGCESWTLTKQQESKIQAVEMKYLRGIKGVTKKDKIRSETIREELKIESIINSIEKQQLRWFGHLVRMNNNRQVKKVWQAQTVQKQKRGRPKKKWDDTIVEHLKKRNKTWPEAKKMTRNKKLWATFVNE